MNFILCVFFPMNLPLYFQKQQQKSFFMATSSNFGSKISELHVLFQKIHEKQQENRFVLYVRQFLNIKFMNGDFAYFCAVCSAK